MLIDDLVTKVGSTSVATIREARDAFENLKPDVPVVVAVKRGESEIYAAFEAKPVPGAPMMNAIVPIIFLFFLIPGLVHGYVSGRFGNHRDVVKGMSQTMETMGYYLVLVFFAALFIDAFNTSHIGKLIALKGANFIKESELPAAVTIMGIIFLSAAVNLLVGSASAKWAMLAPIFVPMLMLLGISPEMTQAAYRVGDSTTNIITPMMPYFPLVVVFCQKYVKSTGIGTVAAMMLPFSITFLVTWAIFLLIYWQIGVPLGVDSSYNVFYANLRQFEGQPMLQCNQSRLVVDRLRQRLTCFVTRQTVSREKSLPLHNQHKTKSKKANSGTSKTIQ